MHAIHPVHTPLAHIPQTSDWLSRSLLPSKTLLDLTANCIQSMEGHVGWVLVNSGLDTRVSSIYG